MRQPLAGQLLTSQIHTNFRRPTSTRPFPLSLLPRHLISKRDPSPLDSTAIHQPKPLLREDRMTRTTPSWQSWAENSVVEAWKEACCEVVNVRGYDMATANTLPQVNYEFPDGYSKGWGEERYRYSEMLFDPKKYFDQVSKPLLLIYLRACYVAVIAHILDDRTTRTPPFHPNDRPLPLLKRPSIPQSARTR